MAKKKAQPAPHHRKHLNKGEHGGRPGVWHGPSCPNCGMPYAVDAFVGREGTQVCAGCSRKFDIKDALPDQAVAPIEAVKVSPLERKDHK